MGYKELKRKLLTDKKICKENQKLYTEFLAWQEYKLKRTNNLPELDEGCIRTLNSYISKLRNVSTWFNKPLKDITKKDIKKVYDDLENGKIVNNRGEPFQDRQSYYNKIFKSKLFKMICKDEISREVMEFCKPSKNNNHVRFVWEDDVKKLVSVAIQPKQKALIWLGFDVGENIQKLLTLKKKDCVGQINKDTHDREYRIVLNELNLKRSRTPRSELTNYKETVQFLDMILEGKKEEDLIFDFEYSMAVKFFQRAVKLSKVRCETNFGEAPTPSWKDLRSGMACDLLSKGWTIDEIKARLGHTPSSRAIDKYVTYLATGKHKAKRKVHAFKLDQVQYDLEQTKQREKLLHLRIEELQKNMQEQQGLMLKIMRENNKL